MDEVQSGKDSLYTNSIDRISISKSLFINISGKRFRDTYLVLREIGSGAFGRVYRVKHKITNNTFACKQILKTHIVASDIFNREIELLIKMDHPNIIKLYEVYDDKRFIYLVMEECVGGELFDRLIVKKEKKKAFSEIEAANIFFQLMTAIFYCHNFKICHRDLKPENLLFLNKNDDSPLKIIDFGLSQIYKDNGKMNSRVGTVYYMSPEVLVAEYDEKCDIWSAGVILYILLGGDPPFVGNSEMEIYKKIESINYSFPKDIWENISDDAKDLISKMICRSNIRLSAENVLKHKWLQKRSTESKPLSQNFLENIKSYSGYNKIKKAVLTYIASRLSETEVKPHKTYFHRIDVNNDGLITLDEFKQGFSHLNVEGLETIFNQIDIDKSRSISYTEFIAASLDHKMYYKEDKLLAAFNIFDKNGNGKISVNEIMEILNVKKEDEKSLEELFKSFDINNDGELDFNEFLIMMGK